MLARFIMHNHEERTMKSQDELDYFVHITSCSMEQLNPTSAVIEIYDENKKEWITVYSYSPK